MKKLLTLLLLATLFVSCSSDDDNDTLYTIKVTNSSGFDWIDFEIYCMTGAGVHKSENIKFGSLKNGQTKSFGCNYINYYFFGQTSLGVEKTTGWFNVNTDGLTISVGSTKFLIGPQ